MTRSLAHWLGRMVLLLAVIAAAGGANGPARAQLTDWTPAGAGAWAETPEGRVRLIAARTGLDDAAALTLGLQFEMAEGWKLYWRSPGDAGYPPSIDWAENSNLAGTDLLWPVPTRFSVLGSKPSGIRDPWFTPSPPGSRIRAGR